MEKLISLEGGHNGTWFKVLDTKETTVKIYPSIKDGKVLSVLETGFSQDFWKYKKEVAISGHFAMVAGNAVCAAEGILDFLEGSTMDERYGSQFNAKYKAQAINPNCVEIWAIADYNEQVRRVCNAG